jgi:hypothetical protein
MSEEKTTTTSQTSLSTKIKYGIIGTSATIAVISIMGTGGFIGWQLNDAFAKGNATPATQLTASHDTTTSTTVK